MLLEILLAISLGILIGIITGITPGIHVNLVAAMMVSVSAFLLQFVPPLALIVFIVSVAITHTFIDFIPSMFLGVPNPETALSVLPGHKLLLMGFGFEAVKLTTIGCLLCVISSIAIFPFLVLVVPGSYEFIKPFISFILIAVVLFMILKERGLDKKFWAFFIFTLSGVFGFVVLNFPNLGEPLLPMLSGLFGISMLISSLKENNCIPPQHLTDQLTVDKKTLAKSIGAGTFVGTLAGFFPGLGSAQSSILGSCMVGGHKKIGTEGFLILQAGIGMVNFIVSLVSLYTINKARNGAVVAVLKIVEDITFSELIIILAVCLVVGGIATILTMRLVRVFIRFVSKINYQKLSIAVMFFIILLVFLLSGFVGLLVLLIATLIGLIPIYLGIEKNHSMGCILLPVILYFLV